MGPSAVGAANGPLDLVVHHLGLALGGHPGASFARSAAREQRYVTSVVV
jgi:hypothetical protein